MHKIIVSWPDIAFPTSEEAMRVTRMTLVDSAKALGVNEPNVEQFQTRTNEVPTGQPTADTDHLLSTTDAQEWARSFIALFEGQMVGGPKVDEGLMIAWFANAFGVGERMSQPRHADEALDRAASAVSEAKANPDGEDEALDRASALVSEANAANGVEQKGEFA